MKTRKSFPTARTGDPSMPATRRQLLQGLTATSLLGTALLRAAVTHAQEIVDLDVPFVTTPDSVVLAMLEIAGVKASDVLLDLGSGDGRIVITAALRHGARGSGVEIDPRLVELSNSNARKAGVAERAVFLQKDLFATDLSQASVITMYLLPDVNIRMRPALLKLKPGTRIVSHDWDMGDWQPDKAVIVDAPEKKLGLVKQSRLYLWVIPAQLEGRHSTEDGPNQRIEIDLRQKYQRLVGGRLTSPAGRFDVQSGSILGNTVELQAASPDGVNIDLAGVVQDAQIRWRWNQRGQLARSFVTRAVAS